MRFTAVFLSVFATSMICGRAVFAALPVAAPASTPAVGAPVPAATPVVVSPEIAATPLPSSTVTSAFQNGIAAFQKSDFKTACLWFRETLAKDATQIVAWYDLGLTEQKLGNAGLAMAFWRKALALSPTFSAAQHALDFTKAKLEHGDIPHEVETWETLRSGVLIYASAGQFALLTAIFFFAAGWLGLVFIGQRRRAILDEKPLPGFPVASTIMTVLFAGFLILTICKLVDDQDLRATVIAKKVEARALPDTSSTSLFDLYEGLEVIVRQTRKDWIQVTFPGGATGWIPRDSIFTNADRFTP